MTQPKPFNYYDLIETFAQPGCAICNLCQRDVHRYIDSHLYEYVNTPDTHTAMRASRGFCAFHSAQLVEYGASVLGIAILQAAILDELLQITVQAASHKRSRLLNRSVDNLSDRLEPERSCLACEALRRAEKLHLRALADHIHEAPLQEAYRASEGLCLPHFRALLRATADSTQQAIMLSIQTDLWRKLKRELESFAHKYDINHADEAMGAEGDSWRRALSLVFGTLEIQRA